MISFLKSNKIEGTQKLLRANALYLDIIFVTWFHLLID